MKGTYYKAPINFQKIIDKKDAILTNLQESIVGEINLVLTTSFGECKFDPDLGCGIWEMDYDILCNQNVLKTQIYESIKQAIQTNIYRLQLENLKVNVYEQAVDSVEESMRSKKKVELRIIGKIRETNRVFDYYNYFFVGPLSYS